ncbi:MAG: M28 family peptidase [Thermoguttaceae bacterium]|nr:M28 family peptidase [Thermoguttaceae bacterium]
MLRNRRLMNGFCRLWFCVGICGWFCGVASAAEPLPLPPEAIPLLESTISEATLRPIIEQLTAPEYAGRRTQSLGGEKASTELARQLAALGFEPFGTEGFFQPFSRKGLGRDFCTSAFDILDTQPNDVPSEQKSEEPTLGKNGPTVSEEGRLCRNVVGILRGSDPVLRDEYLLLMAHYDHAGRQVWRYRDTDGSEATCTVRTNPTEVVQGPPDMEHDYAFIDGTWRELLTPEFGEYKPGADDNASGCAGILALGRFFASLPRRPARSIIILFADAEEVGLVGSTWFATHLPVPAGRIVFVLNCDMLGRIRDRQVLCGGEQSAFGLRTLLSQHNQSEKTQQALLPLDRATERAIGTDTFEFDFRGTMGAISDHYPFFRLNIPGIVLNSEMHGDYHGVGDTAGKIQFREMTELVRWAASCVYTLAEQPERLVFRAESKQEVAQPTPLTDNVWSPFEQDLGILCGLDPADPDTLVVTEVEPNQWAALHGIAKSDRIISITDETTEWNGEPFEQCWNIRSHTTPQTIQFYEEQHLDQLLGSEPEIEPDPKFLASTSCPNVYNEASGNAVDSSPRSDEVTDLADVEETTDDASGDTNITESPKPQKDIERPKDSDSANVFQVHPQTTVENTVQSEPRLYRVLIERHGRLFHLSLHSAQ